MEEKELLFEKIANSNMDKEMQSAIKDTILKEFKEEGVEEAMKTIDSALDSLKTPECKAMLASYILSKLPIGVQTCTIKNHSELVKVNIAVNLGSNPMSLLMAAANMLKG